MASVSLCCKSRRFKTAYQNFIRKFNALKLAITFLSVSGLSCASSKHIYDRPLTEINVTSVLNLWITFWYLMLTRGCFYKEEKLKPVFVFIFFAFFNISVVYGLT